MICLRCHGRLNRETWVDLADEMGIISIEVLHCLNCGEVVDPMILQHRQSRPAPLVDHARVAPKTALAKMGPTHAE